jgi:hypothetical protein
VLHNLCRPSPSSPLTFAAPGSASLLDFRKFLFQTSTLVALAYEVIEMIILLIH